jgi:hypothetical protein
MEAVFPSLYADTDGRADPETIRRLAGLVGATNDEIDRLLYAELGARREMNRSS